MRSRRRTALLASLALLLLLPVAVWLLRHPIAAHFVDRELARRGVEARYRIAKLGFGRQVLEDVVIGPVGHPDLTARRVVVHTAVGLSGVGLIGLDAEGVRLRGRWDGGRLRLGQVDRLLPPPSGKPFSLPDLPLAIRDVSVELATPAGRVRLAVQGTGNPARSFEGRVAASASRLAASGCVATAVRGGFDATIRRGAPTFAGPLVADVLDCPGRVRASALRLRPKVTIARSFDRLTADLPLTIERVSLGSAQVRGVGAQLRIGLGRQGGSAVGTVTAARLQSPQVTGTDLTAMVKTDGSPDTIRGRVRLMAASLSGFDGAARNVVVAGPVQVALGKPVAVRMEGRASAGGLTLPSSLTAGLSGLDKGLNGTPVEALARRFGLAAQAAARSLSASGTYRLALGGPRPSLTVTSLQARSASGARLALSGGRGVTVPLDGRAIRTLDGVLQVAGGGLPEGTVRLRSDSAGALSGEARFAPYKAGDSRLALAPVRFSREANGRTRLRTVVEVTGPFAGGRVRAASLPIDARLDRSGALAVNTACAPLRFEALSVRGLTLDGASLSVCPDTGRALLGRGATGGLTVAARIPEPRLSGRVGTTPLTLAAKDAAVRLNEGGFAASGLEARVGRGESTTRLDLASLSGTFRGSGASGAFAGGAGQVGAVPILWSQGTGEWSLFGGRLALTADLEVDDAASPVRFQTLSAPVFQLSFAGSQIDAAGPLVDPQTGRVVATATIEHSFARSAGEARLAVRGLTFDDRLQPSRLTPLALGVVADVQGTVSGDARIAWGGPAVTSTGTFTTKGMDLAAAFGPVQGLSTTVRFTDLLNLVTADDQRLTVDTINPGTEVRNGVVRYAIVSGRRIAVRSGRWPFGGGVLDLEPTVLEFGEGRSQQFTLDVTGLDAAVLLNDFGFDNISATGVFDGRFPLTFTDGAGRVAGGELDSRPPGGMVAYVGSVSQEDLGFFGNLAFDALRALRYDHLAVTLNGPLSGSLITGLQFDGLAQGAGAKRNILARAIAGLPFVFKIRIDAPLRQLLGTARSFNDPSLLVEQNLGLLYREQVKETGVDPLTPPEEDRPIQDQESEPSP